MAQKWPKITPNGPKITPGFTHFFRNSFWRKKNVWGSPDRARRSIHKNCARDKGKDLVIILCLFQLITPALSSIRTQIKWEIIRISLKSFELPFVWIALPLQTALNTINWRKEETLDRGDDDSVFGDMTSTQALRPVCEWEAVSKPKSRRTRTRSGSHQRQRLPPVPAPWARCSSPWWPPRCRWSGRRPPPASPAAAS